MNLRDGALQEPAGRGARRVALDLLARVRSERDRLDSPDDAEALHDFRVAVRRLRSCLRAYRSEMEDTMPRRAERWLRRVARATGESRDYEVHITWIETARARQRTVGRIGSGWLLARLREQKAEADLHLRRELDRHLRGVLETAAEGLSRYTAEVEPRAPAFGYVAAALIDRHASEVADALQRVSGPGDRAEAHEARIAAKRLRYLLEPFRDSIPEARPLVEALATLQDGLGELHDAQVFGSAIADAIAEVRDERSRVAGKGRDTRLPGLFGLLRRWRRGELKSFESVQKDWLADGSVRIAHECAAVAEALRAETSKGREIERKFLLHRMPPDMPPATAVEIEQGYLPGERLVERVRRSVASDGTATCYRTVKFGPAADRFELEEEATPRLFRSLWALTVKRRIRKRRHSVEADGFVWEIDEFLDRPLVLAEVELRSTRDAPPMPDWIASVLDREVTEDSAYSNRSLAK